MSTSLDKTAKSRKNSDNSPTRKNSTKSVEYAPKKSQSLTKKSSSNTSGKIRQASIRNRQSFKRTKGKEIDVDLDNLNKNYVFLSCAASDLKAMNLLSMTNSSPYFELYIKGKQIYESEIIKRTDLPAWKRLKLKVKEVEGIESLEIKVLNQNMGQKKTIGFCKVPYPFNSKAKYPIMKDEKHRGWFFFHDLAQPKKIPKTWISGIDGSKQTVRYELHYGQFCVHKSESIIGNRTPFFEENYLVLPEDASTLSIKLYARSRLIADGVMSLVFDDGHHDLSASETSDEFCSTYKVDRANLKLHMGSTVEGVSLSAWAKETSNSGLNLKIPTYKVSNPENCDVYYMSEKTENLNWKLGNFSIPLNTNLLKITVYDEPNEFDDTREMDEVVLKFPFEKGDHVMKFKKVVFCVGKTAELSAWSHGLNSKTGFEPNERLFYEISTVSNHTDIIYKSEILTSNAKQNWKTARFDVPNDDSAVKMSMFRQILPDSQDKPDAGKKTEDGQNSQTPSTLPELLGVSILQFPFKYTAQKISDGYFIVGNEAKSINFACWLDDFDSVSCVGLSEAAEIYFTLSVNDFVIFQSGRSRKGETPVWSISDLKIPKHIFEVSQTQKIVEIRVFNKELQINDGVKHEENEVEDSIIRTGDLIGQQNVRLEQLLSEYEIIDLGENAPKFTTGEATKNSTLESWCDNLIDVKDTTISSTYFRLFDGTKLIYESEKQPKTTFPNFDLASFKVKVNTKTVKVKILGVSENADIPLGECAILYPFRAGANALWTGNTKRDSYFVIGDQQQILKLPQTWISNENAQPVLPVPIKFTVNYAEKEIFSTETLGDSSTIAIFPETNFCAPKHAKFVEILLKNGVNDEIIGSLELATPDSYNDEESEFEQGRRYFLDHENEEVGRFNVGKPALRCVKWFVAAQGLLDISELNVEDCNCFYEISDVSGNVLYKSEVVDADEDPLWAHASINFGLNDRTGYVHLFRVPKIISEDNFSEADSMIETFTYGDPIWIGDTSFSINNLSESYLIKPDSETSPEIIISTDKLEKVVHEPSECSFDEKWQQLDPEIKEDNSFDELKEQAKFFNMLNKLPLEMAHRLEPVSELKFASLHYRVGPNKDQVFIDIRRTGGLKNALRLFYSTVSETAKEGVHFEGKDGEEVQGGFRKIMFYLF